MFQGHKLLSENASDTKVRQFLKTVPGYALHHVPQIDLLHSISTAGTCRRLRHYTQLWLRAVWGRCRRCWAGQSWLFQRWLWGCWRYFAQCCDNKEWLFMLDMHFKAGRVRNCCKFNLVTFCWPRFNLFWLLTKEFTSLWSWHITNVLNVCL